LRKTIVTENGELTYFLNKNDTKGTVVKVANKIVQYSEAKKKPNLLKLGDAKSSLYIYSDSAADKIAFIRAVCTAGAKWSKEKGTSNCLSKEQSLTIRKIQTL